MFLNMLATLNEKIRPAEMPVQMVQPGTPVVEMQDVSFAYGSNRPVVSEISLRAAERDFVAIVGPSGIGKTTLLKMLAGLLEPTAGSILLKGRPPTQTHHGVGIMFQRDNLMDWRTVEDNIRLPLELRGFSKAASHDRVMRLLNLVGLEGTEELYPGQLSGGMAQRVALARALVHEPDILLLDEPFGALDALTRERMGQELLRIWQAMPVTVLMVTHSIAEAVILADRIVVMNGREEQPATITEEVQVTLPRPRRWEMQSEPEFMDCVSAVRAAIE